MINYFDERELKKYNLRRVQNTSHPVIWYIYKNQPLQSAPVRVIKEIPFEDIQLYRALQYENNPNIVKVTDVARLGERVIVEMEFVKGITIGKFMEILRMKQKELSSKECLEIMLQLCNALEACHKIGFVHRDISGNNIMLSVKEGSLRVYLVDFENHHWIKEGCIKDTTTLGTVGYAAPEQWGFSASDPSTDIYAAGILLCQMLTGKGREGVDGIEDGTLRYIVKRCIRLEQDERYRNVYAFISDLRRAYQPYTGYQKKTSNKTADSFLHFMEEEYQIDYANTFLEKPEPVKIPIYVVLVVSLFIAAVWIWFGCGWIILGYIPYSIIVGLYFKNRLEKIEFYYPYSQSFMELREKLYMNLLKNGMQFEDMDDCHLTVMIKKRIYYVTADTSRQTIHIRADWSDKLPGIRKIFYMMEDFGNIVYLLQHLCQL